MEFDESMVGKVVRSNYFEDTTSIGVITKKRDYCSPTAAYILWKTGLDAERESWLLLDEVIFLDGLSHQSSITIELTEITINGKRYKLVEIV